MEKCVFEKILTFIQFFDILVVTLLLQIMIRASLINPYRNIPELLLFLNVLVFILFCDQIIPHYIGFCNYSFKLRDYRLLDSSDCFEMKHFLYYPTTYNSSYTQIFPKIPGKICCFQESLIGREYTTYVHMKYVFCSSQGIGKNGTFLCPNEWL